MYVHASLSWKETSMILTDYKNNSSTTDEEEVSQWAFCSQSLQEPYSFWGFSSAKIVIAHVQSQSRVSKCKEHVAKRLPSFWSTLQISSGTVHRDLRQTGFYGQAAASGWCKVCCLWTVGQCWNVLWNYQSSLVSLSKRRGIYHNMIHRPGLEEYD